MLSIFLIAMVSLLLCCHWLPRTDPFSTAECIYKRRWQGRPTSISSKSSIPASQLQQGNNASSGGTSRSADDDAKLIFGTVFSLRNMARKLGGEDDRYDFVIHDEGYRS